MMGDNPELISPVQPRTTRQCTIDWGLLGD